MAKKKDTQVLGTKEDEIVSNTQQWLNGVASYMSDHKYPTWVRSYEDFQLFMGRRYIELVQANLSWMSNKKYPLIASAQKTFSGILRKLDINKVHAASYLGAEYSEYSDNYETFVRYVFNRPETKASMFEIFDEGLLLGNAYAEVSWKEETKKVLIKASKNENGSAGQYKKIKRAYPVINYLSAFDVMEDITSPTERYIAKKARKSKIQITTEMKLTLSEEKWKECKNGAPLFAYNYNRCKDLGSWEQTIMDKCAGVVESQLRGVRTNYKHLPNAMEWYNLGTEDDVFEVVEAYAESEEETYKVIFINGIYISHWPTKLAFPGAPIVKLKFITIPGSQWGMGLGDFGRPYQDMADTLWNAYMTSQRVLSAPMFTREKPMSQKSNGEQTFTYRPFGIVEVTTGQANAGIDILKIINPADVQGNMAAIQQIEAKFDKEMGLNSYTGGGNAGVERSAKGVTEKKNVTENKIACYLDNINLFLSDLAEKCALLMKAHGEDIETDIPDAQGKMANISADDLYNAFKITFDAEEILGTGEEKTQTLLQTVNAAAPYSIDPGTGESILDMREISRQIFANAGLENVIPSEEKRLEDAKKDVEYMKQKADIIGDQGWDKPKESENISISLKDIEAVMDPSVKQQLYAKIGVQWQPPHPDAAANPFANMQAPQLPQQ